MINYFAGPVELDIPIHVAVFLVITAIVVYALSVLALSWIVATLIEYYATRYAAATDLAKIFKRKKRKGNLTLYIFIVGFVWTSLLYFIAWSSLDHFGPVTSIVLFTLVAVAASTYSATSLFIARNK